MKERSCDGITKGHNLEEVKALKTLKNWHKNPSEEKSKEWKC